MPRDLRSDESRVLAAIGSLHEEGATPPYSKERIEEVSGWMRVEQAGSITSALTSLYRRGLVSLVRELGKTYVYPVGDLPPGVPKPKRLSVPSRKGVFSPFESHHRILGFLNDTPSGSRRIDIERHADVDFSGNALPLQRLLVAGLIDHPDKRTYRITKSGKKALKELNSGEVVKTPELDPDWMKYFEERTW